MLGMAGFSFYALTQRLRAGLSCDAPPALRREVPPVMAHSRKSLWHKRMPATVRGRYVTRSKANSKQRTANSKQRTANSRSLAMLGMTGFSFVVVTVT